MSRQNENVPVGTTLERDIDAVVIDFDDYRVYGYCRPRGWRANAFITSEAVAAAGWDGIEWGTILVCDVVMGPKGENAVNLREKTWEESSNA